MLQLASIDGDETNVKWLFLKGNCHLLCRLAVDLHLDTRNIQTSDDDWGSTVDLLFNHYAFIPHKMTGAQQMIFCKITTHSELRR